MSFEAVNMAISAIPESGLTVEMARGIRGAAEKYIDRDEYAAIGSLYGGLEKGEIKIADATARQFIATLSLRGPDGLGDRALSGLVNGLGYGFGIGASVFVLGLVVLPGVTKFFALSLGWISGVLSFWGFGLYNAARD